MFTCVCVCTRVCVCAHVGMGVFVGCLPGVLTCWSGCRGASLFGVPSFRNTAAVLCVECSFILAHTLATISKRVEGLLFEQVESLV